MMCVILGEPPKALSTALRSLYCIYIKNGATIDSVGNTIERERRRNRLGSEVSFCFFLSLPRHLLRAIPPVSIRMD